ncbi:XrtA system polysaccharide deacetylase [Geoalkalibacter sp.]|uniref:XrtA system polysaccharide deacetylase n=1 Tax=Geoalkalibacter sp. TaxID=3041440 RepID=UPI00272DCD35|nr:XrtA system polysaccharide deacetylase [Geoalkalibacter sp.]
MTLNALSIDVEDYFQVSAFEGISPPDTWECRELRVERNTERVLELLDEAGGVRATFFILGWVAERCPDLVRRIAAGGHEIASHGFGHQRICFLDPAAFREDVRRSKGLLEDLCGRAVHGYRAPSYSISERTPWAFDELHAAGYLYDSSICPVRHDFYGMPHWPRFSCMAVKGADGSWCPLPHTLQETKALHSIPVSTVRLGGRNIPIAGGGYFRLFPYAVTRWGLNSINTDEKRPFVFYLHPWELDPGQPRMSGAGWKSRFRHYLNLDKTEKRFVRLLKDFRFAPIREVFGIQ